MPQQLALYQTNDGLTILCPDCGNQRTYAYWAKGQPAHPHIQWLQLITHDAQCADCGASNQDTHEETP
jgi:uncharacterized protein (DUF983 family)